MQVCRVLCETHEARITCIALDQPRNLIWVAAEHGDIRVLPLSDGNRSTLKGHKGHVTGMTFLDGMNVMVSASVDGNCILWDAERLQILQASICRPQCKCARCNRKITTYILASRCRARRSACKGCCCNAQRHQSMAAPACHQTGWPNSCRF